MKFHFSTSFVAFALVVGSLASEAWTLLGKFQVKMLHAVPVGLAFRGSLPHILLGAAVLILGISIVSLYFREIQ